jgi:hypothetical protein
VLFRKNKDFINVTAGDTVTIALYRVKDLTPKEATQFTKANARKLFL